jgi:RNA polymerase sigma-70 factor (ECF subfamily)
MTEPTDRELWRRAGDGEPECFGVIFDRHASAVHGYCRARTGDPHDAQDLVSVVFLEAWRHRRRVKLHEESALPWLLGVAHRVVLKRHRSTSRHRAALARLPSVPPEPDPADEVASRVDDTRRLGALRSALTQLRPGDQEVLARCVWGGLDYASAAVAMGVPVGTVRSRLGRARARLARLAEPPQELVDGADHRAAGTHHARPPALQEQS